MTWCKIRQITGFIGHARQDRTDILLGFSVNDQFSCCVCVLVSMLPAGRRNHHSIGPVVRVPSNFGDRGAKYIAPPQSFLSLPPVLCFVLIKLVISFRS